MTILEDFVWRGDNDMKKTVLLFCSFLFSQDTINVDLNSNVRSVPLFGLNNSSMRYNNWSGCDTKNVYSWGESDFNAATLCFKPQILRYPGGNESSYFDWINEWVFPKDSIVNYINSLDLSYSAYHTEVTNGDYFWTLSNDSLEYWGERGEYHWWYADQDDPNRHFYPIDISVVEFSNLIEKNNIKGTFVMNMLTDSVQSAMEMIEEYEGMIPFDYVELGNEYYLRSGGDKWVDTNGNYMFDPTETLTVDSLPYEMFNPGRYEFIYPSPASYAEACNTWIDSLNKMIPDAKFGFTAKDRPSDPRSKDWNYQVLSHIDPSLIDTFYLAWHEYFTFKDNNLSNGLDSLSAEQVLAFSQYRTQALMEESGMDSLSIDQLESSLGIKVRLWLTESNFREKGYGSGNEPWVFKWAHTLVNVQYFSEILTNPYVEIMMLHSLMGYNSTSAINHGCQFPSDGPAQYSGEDSCSPYGRTASGLSIYFWAYVSEGMTEMQQLRFSSINNDHIGEISSDDAGIDSSPNVGYEYQYLLGWKLQDAYNNERALMTNISNSSKFIDINGTSIFSTNKRQISITSKSAAGIPSIDQYVNGDLDLFFDTTIVYINTNQILEIPAYSITIFEYFESLDIQSGPLTPANFALHQNYPNPFNPITSLRYDLPEQAQVTLTIYDMLGREVTQLINTTQEAGSKSVQWDATDSFGIPVSAGVYLYQIRAGEFVQTRKMVLLK